MPDRDGSGSDTLAPVRRLIVLGGIAFAGNAAAGKSVFASSGCGGCHTFKAAGTNATIGPNLSKVTADAKSAGQPLATFTQDSIVNPNAFIAKGYQANVMPQTFGQSLSAKQIADVVAFINQNQ